MLLPLQRCFRCLLPSTERHHLLPLRQNYCCCWRHHAAHLPTPAAHRRHQCQHRHQHRARRHRRRQGAARRRAPLPRRQQRQRRRQHGGRRTPCAHTTAGGLMTNYRNCAAARHRRTVSLRRGATCVTIAWRPPLTSFLLRQLGATRLPPPTAPAIPMPMPMRWSHWSPCPPLCHQASDPPELCYLTPNHHPPPTAVGNTATPRLTRH